MSNSSNSTPVVLWIFSVSTGGKDNVRTVAKDAHCAVSKLVTRAPDACIAGDLVHAPGKGWLRILEVIFCGDDAARFSCTTAIDAQDGVGNVSEELVSGPAQHVFTRVLPASVRTGDTLLCGSLGSRFYGLVQDIQFHSDKWHNATAGE